MATTASITAGQWLGGYQAQAPLSYISGSRSRPIDGHMISGAWSDPWWLYGGRERGWAVARTWRSRATKIRGWADGHTTVTDFPARDEIVLTALADAPGVEPEAVEPEAAEVEQAAATPRRQRTSTAGQTFPPEPLTSAEVRALLGKCSRRAPTGIRNRALIMVLYRSGLRISEALALKPASIDLEHHSARVLHGKGDKATVRPLHPSADDALMRWLDRRQALGLANGPLFCTLDGGPLSDRYVRDLLKRLAAKAGVGKRVHPHGLRHTYADELEKAGLPVSVISRALGHSSIAVTARYLGHLSNSEAVDAVAALDLPDVE